MKKITFPIAAIFCAAVVCSCNNSGDTTTSTDTATTTTTTTDTSTGMGQMTDTGSVSSSMNNSANATPLAEMDKNFVMKAAAGGMMEVELGNMAQQNASSQRVKDFGAMMVRDHGKANQELMSFASRRNVMLNQDSLMSTHKSDMDKLKGKTGAAFDKAYMSMMVKDHQKDVNEFEKASKMCKDQECLAFAGKTLPVLQMHLDSAQAINKSLK
jgi:putative membrane protein